MIIFKYMIFSLLLADSGLTFKLNFNTTRNTDKNEAYYECSKYMFSLKTKDSFDENDWKAVDFCLNSNTKDSDFAIDLLLSKVNDDIFRNQNISRMQNYNEYFIGILNNYEELYNKADYSNINDINYTLNKVTGALVYLGTMKEKRILSSIDYILDFPMNSTIGIYALYAENLLKKGFSNHKCDQNYNKKLNENFYLKTCSQWSNYMTGGTKYELYFHNKLIAIVSLATLINENEIFYHEIIKQNDNMFGEYEDTGEYFIFKKGKKEALKNKLKFFDIYFSSPNIINGKIFYWGLEKISDDGQYNIYAIQYDPNNSKSIKKKLYKGFVNTNDTGYFAKPFLRNEKIYFLYSWGSWIFSLNFEKSFMEHRLRSDI